MKWCQFFVGTLVGKRQEMSRNHEESRKAVIFTKNKIKYKLWTFYSAKATMKSSLPKKLNTPISDRNVNYHQEFASLSVIAGCK